MVLFPTLSLPLLFGLSFKWFEGFFVVVVASFLHESQLIRKEKKTVTMKQLKSLRTTTKSLNGTRK